IILFVHEFVRKQLNCGPRTLAEIGALSGGGPDPLDKSPREAIAEALMRSIADFREALEAAEAAITALHRSGFIISSRTASTLSHCRCVCLSEVAASTRQQ